MGIRFRAKPGSHERQLLRYAENLLFPVERRAIEQRDVDMARIQDDNERRDFELQLREAVQACIDLEPQSDSEILLTLKEHLDQLYERSATLAGEVDEWQAALNQLIELIMHAVRKGAGEDRIAQGKLEAEDEARAIHQQMLAYPLIADLLRDDIIPEDELVITLLGESQAACEAAWSLFDAEQQALMLEQAVTLLRSLEEGPLRTRSAERVEMLRQAMPPAFHPHHHGDGHLHG